MATIQFTDNSAQVKAALDGAIVAYLYEAAGELEAQTKRNTRVDTGNTKSSWSYHVDEAAGKAVVGSTLENAIWEEFGTGEYALHNDGRKGGWHHTYGKKPNRAFQKAFNSLKNKLIQRAEKILKARMK